MSETLIPPTFLFRFAVPCYRHKGRSNAKAIKLTEGHRIAAFGELAGDPLIADLRIGWNHKAIFIQLRVSGKKQLAWCRQNRIEDSDGLRLWIDTRNTHNIHRASRFCHQFVFLPFGAGNKFDEPAAVWLPINRARELSKPIAPTELMVRSQKLDDGYSLEGIIPTAKLTGWAPEDHPHLGFMYAVEDRELGTQTFSVDAEFPYADDPSLWGTLDLVDESPPSVETSVSPNSEDK
jgi:hypothetical protein